MATPIMTKMVGLHTTFQIWNQLQVYYASQTRSRIKKLKTQLKILKCELTHIYISSKKIVDTLATTSSPISNKEHLEAILDGLSKDYESSLCM